MLTLVVAVVVAAAIVAAVSLLRGRARRDDEVERFHRARQMTTEWARSGVNRPVGDATTDEEAPEPVGQGAAPRS